MQRRSNPLAEVLGQVVWQLAGGEEADFVEHAPEIDDASDFLIRTAWVLHGKIKRVLEPCGLRGARR